MSNPTSNPTHLDSHNAPGCVECAREAAELDSRCQCEHLCHMTPCDPRFLPGHAYLAPPATHTAVSIFGVGTFQLCWECANGDCAKLREFVANHPQSQHPKPLIWVEIQLIDDDPANANDLQRPPLG